MNRAFNGLRQIGNTLRGHGSRVVATGVAVGGLVASARADAPTTLDGFSTVATGYISTGTATAIAAGVLALGWVGFKIVKRFTNGAK